MINDPQSVSQAFDDQTIQNQLDQNREDIWYEQLQAAPAIVNTASTGNKPLMVFADFYSNYKWLEGDAVVQGNNTSTGQAYIVLTPVAFEPIVGHFQFQTNVLTQGVSPGQFPPVFFIGKSYDPYATSADLLDIRVNQLSLTTFDFTSDGQSFRVGQIIDNLRKTALSYRRNARPKIAKMTRGDIMPEIDSKSVPILGGDGTFGGIY